MVFRRGPDRQQGPGLPPLVAAGRAPAGRATARLPLGTRHCPRTNGGKGSFFTAIRPATGEDVTLVLPAVNTAAMQVFLDHVAASRPADAHLVMVLDGAGWHVSRNLVVPPNITLVVLPPLSLADLRWCCWQTRPRPALGLEARAVAWARLPTDFEPEQLPGADAPTPDPADQGQAL